MRGIRIIPKLCLLCVSLSTQAQQEELVQAPESQRDIEEVMVTGQRNLLQLRMQVITAEKNAYDIFNKFNDEKRFDISCSMHQPTGTRIERQVCQPEFQIEATRAHARAYFDNLCDLLCYGNLPNSSQITHAPQETRIASQHGDYQRKIKQVAEQHPEFLEALIQYTEIKGRYEEATRTVKEDE